MARPARQPAELDDPPLHDPASVERAYQYHRLRRHTRVERRLERRQARRRFWLTAGLLFLLSLVIGVTIWDRVQGLFGL
jgi:hypothetical protein